MLVMNPRCLVPVEPSCDTGSALGCCPTDQVMSASLEQKNPWSCLFGFFSGSKFWMRRRASKSPSLWPSPGHPWQPFESPGTFLSEGPISWARQCSRMERTRPSLQPPPREPQESLRPAYGKEERVPPPSPRSKESPRY